MADLEQFTRHYLKISSKTSLTPKEKLYVKQLFDFIGDNGSVKTQVAMELEKIRCPVCETEFVVPKC